MFISCIILLDLSIAGMCIAGWLLSSFPASSTHPHEAARTTDGEPAHTLVASNDARASNRHAMLDLPYIDQVDQDEDSLTAKTKETKETKETTETAKAANAKERKPDRELANHTGIDNNRGIENAVPFESDWGNNVHAQAQAVAAPGFFSGGG